MRLQKYMAQAGVASRRRCEEYIAQGRVRINGAVASIGQSVNPEHDEIWLDGAPLTPEAKRVVILFYKPRGVVSTLSDPEGRKTVACFFSQVQERLFNVGRLDVDSEGLLLMTNDGELTQYLTHPRFEVEKTYYVVTDGVLTDEQAAALMNGVTLSDGMTAPARVERMRPTKTGQTSFCITIHEGRNRQVRRMLEAVGHKTLLLKRERIGRLSLAGLRPGEWRYATDMQMQYFDELLHRDKDKL